MRAMTKETIRASLHSPECLAFVKNRLNSIQQLPVEGFVAGQAVSSAVVEFLKMDYIINPVYNDIDVFKYINKGQMTVEQAKRFAGKANATVLNRELQHTTGTYGQLMETFYYSDKIVDSVQVGDFINETTIMRVQRPTSINSLTLAKFDINSTQVGFSIKEDTLLFTENFLLFLVTKELQIVSLTTPVHSIIRLHKKQAELGVGVYADFKTNELLAYMQATFSIAYKNQKVVQEDQEGSYYHPVFFGEKHKDDFFKYGLDDKGHTLFSEDVSRRTGSKEDSRVVSAILSTLAIPSVTDKFYDYASSLGGYGMDKNHQRFMGIFSGELDICMLSPGDLYSLSKVPEDTHRMKRVRRSASSALSDVSFHQRQVLQRVHGEKDLLGLALNVNVDTLKESLKVGKFLADHDMGILEYYLHLSSVAPDKKLKILQNVQTVEKESGILAGDLETMSDRYTNGRTSPNFTSFVDIEAVRAFVESRKLALSTPFEKRKERGVSFTVGDYVVTELVSPLELRKEGSAMKHCVGGYSRSVANGDSIIISISCRNASLSKKEAKLHSFTLQLVNNDEAFFASKLPFQGRFYKKYKKPYRIGQLQSFCNESGVFHPDLVEVFHRIYEIYPTSRMPLSNGFSNQETASAYLPKLGAEKETTLAYRVAYFVHMKTFKFRSFLPWTREGKQQLKKMQSLNPFCKKSIFDVSDDTDLDWKALEIPF